MYSIFDGHNDLLSRLAAQQCSLAEVKDGITARPDRDRGHIDLPRARQGGLVGGFFALFVDGETDFGDVLQAMQSPPYHIPLPAVIEQSTALPKTLHQVALLKRLERMGVVCLTTDTSTIRRVIDHGTQLAAIMHLEGAEAIDADFYNLEVLYAAGLRSLGPVWSRNNLFGHGVPFAYPSDADHGSGLTDLGIKLVKACNQLGIMLDVSHLNAQGFWDLANHSQKPIVATHSAAYSICPHSRNLSDDQLRAIANSDGLVGLNFASATLRPDGKSTTQTDFEPFLRQLDHLISLLGEDRVAFGSDFDGATIPEVIGDCTGLPKLMNHLSKHGYDDALLHKLAQQNWLAVLDRVWL